MQIFPSLPDEPQLSDVYRRFPHTLPPLLDCHDRLLCDPSPLTVAERELIASYVSGLNACTFCHGAHRVAAEIYGIDEGVIDALMRDIDAAPVDQKLKPILRYVRKLTLSPNRIVPADAEAVFAAGWDEQALFDAISVCALFNFMNRIVEGCGDQVRSATGRPGRARGAPQAPPRRSGRVGPVSQRPALRPPDGSLGHRARQRGGMRFAQNVSRHGRSSSSHVQALRCWR